ncbi:MAG: leucine-rich repeat domain-containing protein [Candidatus Kapabacteria bacterium]|nr:leucine-rich repeat domain-containing protein [Candidatus Kapabacteria bacterium]
MHTALTFAILVVLTIVQSSAQTQSMQKPAGGQAQDSSASDTSSFRSRRLRAPRPPRPGIFTSLDSARTMPDSVIYLSVRGKGLSSLQGLAQFKNLQVLDASGNELQAFPMELLKLSKVVSLDLSDNPIKTIPQEIGTMTALTRINLRNTSITSLPPTVGLLSNLSNLDVAKNPLTSLPVKELNRLPRLKSISLGQLPQTDAETAEPTAPDAKPAPSGNK